MREEFVLQYRLSVMGLLQTGEIDYMGMNHHCQLLNSHIDLIFSFPIDWKWFQGHTKKTDRMPEDFVLQYRLRHGSIANRGNRLYGHESSLSTIE